MKTAPLKAVFILAGRSADAKDQLYIKVDLPWPVTDPMDLNFSVTCLGLFFRWTIHYDLQDCPFRLIKSSSFDRAV